jgi:putative SOS response-associated peptidase YedK
MISHYALYTISELSNRFAIAAGLPKGIKPTYNYTPTQSAPVVVNYDGTPTVEVMKWGLVAKGAKDTNSVFRYKTYTIPSEKILSKHSWEQAVRERRCLVPANGYFELYDNAKKQAYYIHPSADALIAFAGVYSTWDDPEGNTHGTYSILTIDTPSPTPGENSGVPIIIKREDEQRWLNTDITDAGSLYDMLRPYPADLLQMHEVSPAVHSPKQNLPSLIDPV